MKRDALDLGTFNIPRLFRIYFIPTLLGMLALCAVTVADGIFVGQGVGDKGLAAVNICIPPTMLLVGIGLMLGMGASVVASIYYAQKNIKAARLNITQAILAGTLITIIFLIITLVSPSDTGRVLGSSETLLPLVKDYMPWIFTCCLFQIWCVVGLFVIRLDGSPTYAMWCNIIPGLLNVVLDYLFIFPLGMGVKGAGIATCISCMVGGIMVMIYLLCLAQDLKLIKIKRTLKSLRLTLRNIGYQCKIGISALLGESTMGVLMLMGNLTFMKYVGDAGVGAFSIACYYCPFAFMIGNAIAQSAQPIISYNYGIHRHFRVIKTEKLAILTAIISGLTVTLIFLFFPHGLVSFFINDANEAAVIAHNGLPYFSIAFIFFIFNLTAIGYFQSIEKAFISIVFALLRGAVFLIPGFIFLPQIFGVNGIWLSLPFSEILTSICIILYYLVNRHTSLRHQVT